MCDQDAGLTPEESKKRKVDSHKRQDNNFNPSEDQNLSPKQDQNQLSLAGPSNEESSPCIFNLDIDCFEELFEWLSAADLFALRRTNKRFKKIVDFFIKTNYPAFGKFKLFDTNFDMFRQMDSITIGMMKEIDISVDRNFDGSQFESIKEVLSKVMEVSIRSWTTPFDFHNSFLKYCNNMQCLTIHREEDWDPHVEMSKEWLCHRYPSLEYICFEAMPKDKIDGFIKFFHLNPNIHALSTDLESLKTIGSKLVGAGIKFDRLGTFDSVIDKDSLHLLKRLHDDGLYKRLRLSLDDLDIAFDEEEDLNLLASVAIEVIKNESSVHALIHHLPSLKEIIFHQHCDIHEDYENTQNVERVYSDGGFSDDIMAFTRTCPKLKHILVQNVHDTNHLNLVRINNERSKLAGACKTTIYVDEHMYLAMKFSGISKTNYKFIELKRTLACNWKQMFENGVCGSCAISKQDQE